MKPGQPSDPAADGAPEMDSCSADKAYDIDVILDHLASAGSSFLTEVNASSSDHSISTKIAPWSSTPSVVSSDTDVSTPATISS